MLIKSGKYAAAATQILTKPNGYLPVTVNSRSKAWVRRPLAGWACGFESHRGRGCLSVVSVVCCQVEVSASGWLFVNRSPFEFGVS